ncbi:methionine biosynthesis PLP-dependent protein [Bacillus sp. PS06]|uniref:methionine biosynthesis PLP-dependent protein n=1 Tax=Bacillus sp. PS06 TaxID=2764176 RepID=UPI00177F530D|nr:methionine biosynthesis PLP-dependent protein [Bacillus sp. PS06]MBD8067477.1 methionine biosynthesis PLP-dependent protein [Bacillus sp. PS06]
MTKLNIETTLAQIGNRSDTVTGTVNPPVYFSTAYRHEGIGQSTGFDYVRTGNPTRKIVEDAIATLENGLRGFAFSSGMAAIHTIMSLFKQGDDLIVSSDLYGGTYRLFEQGWRKFGITFQYSDFKDSQEVEALIKSETKAIFLETPTNPLMQETDIEAVAAIAKKHNLLLIVDNTFYTPIIQKPLDAGADIVIHSATKYLGGHNDVLAGLVVAKDEKICETIGQNHNASGAVLSPFDSWLLIRGMKTLSLRMNKHQENAIRVAEYLEAHEDILDVLYPGKGGMLSFRIKDEHWVNAFLQNLKVISFAESLGGIESFITYPATQTHMDIPEEIRIKNGVCNRLLRFSVGVENVEDIIEDLSQSLSKVKEG